MLSKRGYTTVPQPIFEHTRDGIVTDEEVEDFLLRRSGQAFVFQWQSLTQATFAVKTLLYNSHKATSLDTCVRILLIQTWISYELNLITEDVLTKRNQPQSHILRRRNRMESEQIFARGLKREMRGIRQRIGKEKDSRKKTQMLKAYRRMSKALGVCLH